MEENKRPPYLDDEISLKEMILTIMAYFREVKKNLPLLLISALAVIGIMYGYRQYKGYQYKTFLNYVIDDRGFSAPLNSLAPVGFQVQTDSKQLMLVASSDETLKKVLQTPYQESTIASYLIAEYHLAGKIDVDEMGLYQLGRMLFRIENNKPTGIFEIKEGVISATTVNGELSEALVTALYAAIDYFYQIESKEKAVKALLAIKSGKDSLKAIVEKLENMRVEKVDEEEWKDLIATTKTQYFQTSEKEKDLTVLLETVNPGLKPVSRNIMPEKIGYNPNKKIGTGITLGLILGLGLIIGRKMWRDAMA